MINWKIVSFVFSQFFRFEWIFIADFEESAQIHRVECEFVQIHEKIRRRNELVDILKRNIM